MREDRILNEVQATGGDARRICDLFGLTVDGVIRDLPATPQLDAADTDSLSSPTHGFPRPALAPRTRQFPPPGPSVIPNAPEA